jgi:outer membrane protein assembly factor BamB
MFGFVERVQQRIQCRTLPGVGCVLMLLAGIAAGQVPNRPLPEPFEASDVIWEIELGSHQYSIPRIDNGVIFLGIDDKKINHPAAKPTGGGITMCIEQATGKMLWQLATPRYMEGVKAPFHFDQWECGICSRPAIDGKRLYIVGSRGDVLCLDRNGQADGNDGPFRDELAYMQIKPETGYRLGKQDGDIIWKYNMVTEIGVIPHDVCGSSPLLVGDYLYACTSNGQDDVHKTIPNPEAPSLIVLDKLTGKLVATDGEKIGRRMFHGHWSSPVAATVDGKTTVLFGGGDGVLYAFEPVAVPASDGKPFVLKKLWQYDCNPADYRTRDGKTIRYSGWQAKSPDGPSEVISTPVVDGFRAYVAIGQSPVHGVGRGMLSCVDVRTGAKIWDSRKVDRTLCDVAISDGLLYIADYSAKLHCFDAETGDWYWSFEMDAGVWGCTPVVANGRVYICDEKNILWVLQAGKEMKLLSRTRLQSVAITPVVSDGVFYLPTQKALTAYAIRPGR